METSRLRRRGRRRTILGLVAVALALVFTMIGVARRGPAEEPRSDDGDDARLTVAFPEALAAPPRPDKRADAGVPEEAAAPLVTAPDDAGTEPVDLAIAPDGGVPFHPDAGAFRSPFARPGAGAAARAKVGLLLNSVDDYDVKTGTFTADFFLSFTSATPMPTVSLTAANGTMESTKVLADRPTFKLLRVLGKFKSAPNLRNYPFDSQDLKIVLEDDVHGIDQLRFSVDKERTQLGRGFRALGWQVMQLEARSLSQSYPDRFENDDLYYSRYVFTLTLERFATSAAFKVFVPAFVIVLISLLGMWVPPEEMEVRSNSGAPMLAGAVLFHFALMQELPATSYMTRADKLMLGTYVCLALGMLSTWCMFLVNEHKMDRVFRIARIAVPVVSVIVMAAAVGL